MAASAAIETFGEAQVWLLEHTAIALAFGMMILCFAFLARLVSSP